MSWTSCRGTREKPRREARIPPPICQLRPISRSRRAIRDAALPVPADGQGQHRRRPATGIPAKPPADAGAVDRSRRHRRRDGEAAPLWERLGMEKKTPGSRPGRDLPERAAGFDAGGTDEALAGTPLVAEGDGSRRRRSPRQPRSSRMDGERSGPRRSGCGVVVTSGFSPAGRVEASGQRCSVAGAKPILRTDP